MKKTPNVLDSSNIIQDSRQQCLQEGSYDTLDENEIIISINSSSFLDMQDHQIAMQYIKHTYVPQQFETNVDVGRHFNLESYINESEG